jgi:DNA-binding winged helix-turn-helix (wHTH) protein
MDGARCGITRFGIFEIDSRTGDLRKHGIRIALQEKPAQILHALIAQPGQVVSRDELRRNLWKDSFVDFDHSINIAISKLRHALGDSGANPRFVQTVSRYGYRFLRLYMPPLLRRVQRAESCWR